MPDNKHFLVGKIDCFGFLGKIHIMLEIWIIFGPKINTFEVFYIRLFTLQIFTLLEIILEIFTLDFPEIVPDNRH